MQGALDKAGIHPSNKTVYAKSEIANAIRSVQRLDSVDPVRLLYAQ